MAVDAFTEGLRWAVAIVVGAICLFVICAIIGSVFMTWWQRYTLKRRRRIYDWEVDGGVEEDFTEDMYPRTHVHLPDGVPNEWMQEWT